MTNKFVSSENIQKKIELLVTELKSIEFESQKAFEIHSMLEKEKQKRQSQILTLQDLLNEDVQPEEKPKVSSKKAKK